MPRARRQVVEADVDEERQPVADLADEVAGDVLLVVGRASSSLKKPSAARAASG